MSMTLAELLNKPTHTAADVSQTWALIHENQTPVTFELVNTALQNENHHQFLVDLIARNAAQRTEEFCLSREDFTSKILGNPFLYYRLAKKYLPDIAYHLYHHLDSLQPEHLDMQTANGNNLFHAFSETKTADDYHAFDLFERPDILKAFITLATQPNNKGFTPLHNLIRDNRRVEFLTSVHIEGFDKAAPALKGVPEKSDTLVMHVLKTFIPKDKSKQTNVKLEEAYLWIKAIAEHFGPAFANTRSMLDKTGYLWYDTPDVYLKNHLKTDLLATPIGKMLRQALDTLKSGQSLTDDYPLRPSSKPPTPRPQDGEILKTMQPDDIVNTLLTNQNLAVEVLNHFRINEEGEISTDDITRCKQRSKAYSPNNALQTASANNVIQYLEENNAIKTDVLGAIAHLDEQLKGKLSLGTQPDHTAGITGSALAESTQPIDDEAISLTDLLGQMSAEQIALECCHDPMLGYSLIKHLLHKESEKHEYLTKYEANIKKRFAETVANGTALKTANFKVDNTNFNEFMKYMLQTIQPTDDTQQPYYFFYDVLDALNEHNKKFDDIFIATGLWEVSDEEEANYSLSLNDEDNERTSENGGKASSKSSDSSASLFEEDKTQSASAGSSSAPADANKASPGNSPASSPSPSASSTPLKDKSKKKDIAELTSAELAIEVAKRASLFTDLLKNRYNETHDLGKQNSKTFRSALGEIAKKEKFSKLSGGKGFKATLNQHFNGNPSSLEEVLRELVKLNPSLEKFFTDRGMLTNSGAKNEVRTSPRTTDTSTASQIGANGGNPAVSITASQQQAAAQREQELRQQGVLQTQMLK